MRARRGFVLGTFAFSILLGNASYAQDDYPSRPIRFIVPYGAGGPADNLGRLIADRLTTLLEQQVFVENRPGAAGAIGLEAIARAAPDGYTIGIGGSHQITISPTTFDPLDDFTYVSQLTRNALFFITSTTVPAATISDLITYGRANPGKLNYGNTGIGTIEHLLVEQIALKAGMQVTPVVYKGAAQAMHDLMAGRIHLVVTSAYAQARQYAESGNVSIAGVWSDNRVRFAPEVPTLGEQGYGDIQVPVSQNVVGPKGMPQAIVTRLDAAIRTVLSSDEVKQRFEGTGLTMNYLGSRETAERMRGDAAHARKVEKMLGIQRN